MQRGEDAQLDGLVISEKLEPVRHRHPPAEPAMEYRNERSRSEGTVGNNAAATPLLTVYTRFELAAISAVIRSKGQKNFKP